MRWLAIAVMLSGCHLVFGLERDDDEPPSDAGIEIDAPDALFIDLDKDGVNDGNDPCIASSEDDHADDDGDNIDNVVDACPFNATVGSNADGDDLPDACDPFTSTAGDHHLCVMTFAKTDLANALWQPRAAPEISWSPNPGLLRAIPAGNEIATVIAAASLEGANVTTYQAVFSFLSGTKPGGITLWLRADPNASMIGDVGCHVEGTAGTGVGTIGVTTPTGFKDQKTITYLTTMTNGMRIQGSLATVGANVLATCRFTLNGAQPTTTTAMVPLVPGRMGFTTDRWDTTVTSLYVTDRP